MDQFLHQGLTRDEAKGKGLFRNIVRLIYPPLCLACGAETDSENGLCGTCWGETHFITGPACDVCGTPLPGQAPDETLICEGCNKHPPVWKQGRAAVVYEGAGRRAALALKHGDRLDIAKPVAHWMVRSGYDVLRQADILVPVPLHWTRLFKRKFNQAAVLADQIAFLSGIPTCPDLLQRTKRTNMQKGMSREERFTNQAEAISVHKRRVGMVKDKRITLIDDVLTTGATLSACAEACLANGAASVNILVLARVAREE